MKDNKMVAVTLRFWTNDLEIKMDNKKRTACWDSGMAIMEKNDTKKIKNMTAPFNCYEDILPLIKELFRKNKVLVASHSGKPRVLSHKRKSE